MTAPKAILFDFDGTLADTFEVAVGIFNQLSEEFGYRPVLEADLPAARKMGAREIIEEYGISSRRLPLLASKGLKLLHEHMCEIQPFEGIGPLLRDLHSRGIQLGILTSNSEENVTIFLKRYDMEVFDFIRPSSRLFGKARVIRSILKKNGWKQDEVLFVGDECRDIEAAKKAGIRMVAVTWGFNTHEALAALDPTDLISHPAELLALVSGEGK